MVRWFQPLAVDHCSRSSISVITKEEPPRAFWATGRRRTHTTADRRIRKVGTRCYRPNMSVRKTSVALEEATAQAAPEAAARNGISLSSWPADLKHSCPAFLPAATYDHLPKRWLGTPAVCSQ